MKIGHSFEIWHIYLAITLSSVFNTFGNLAYTANISLLGVLAKTIGLIIGVGKGRGIGLLFIITGILTITSTVVAYQYPRLRLLEKELPDVI